MFMVSITCYDNVCTLQRHRTHRTMYRLRKNKKNMVDISHLPMNRSVGKINRSTEYFTSHSVLTTAALVMMKSSFNINN